MLSLTSPRHISTLRTAVVHSEVLDMTLALPVPDDDEHVVRPDIVLGQGGRNLLVGGLAGV